MSISITRGIRHSHSGKLHCNRASSKHDRKRAEFPAALHAPLEGALPESNFAKFLACQRSR